VFNEILTGKATLTPEPPTAGPYRTETVPMVSATCIACLQPFTVRAGTPAQRCGPCHVAHVEANMAHDVAVRAGIRREAERRRRNDKILRYTLTAAAIVALAFYKLGYRNQLEEDAAIANGERPGYYAPQHDHAAAREDRFAQQVEGFATTMCGCADRACAERTQAEFARFSRDAEAPSDKDVLDVAAESVHRLEACYLKLR
jgi:hypothetical protein